MNDRERKILHLVRIASLLAAIVCIAIGAARGEVQIVLRKAVRVCLECIGVAR